jgi:DhnA family fructose-bisphosphate aldolase class Ia
MSPELPTPDERAASTLDFARLRELRATRPDAVRAAAAARIRRPLLGEDGRLMIVAADHPARGALGVRDATDAMADRYDLLRRLVAALARPGVDGVLGTPDILEDLLLLGALDRKVVIGSMNRGGLQGSVFELDDRFTGYDAAGIAAMGFDGGKMLTRIDLSDPGTVATLEASGHAVTELAGREMMAMVEPFLSRRVDGRVVNDLSAPAVAKSVAIVSGLGATSAYTWLKLPVVDDMAVVMAATTLPSLLLGGDPSGQPAETYAKWREALRLPGVRGLVVGRALLYPPDGDVAGAVDAAVALVRSDQEVTA